MGRYGKDMRDCCDSVAKQGVPHIKGCEYEECEIVGDPFPAEEMPWNQPFPEEVQDK